MRYWLCGFLGLLAGSTWAEVIFEDIQGHQRSFSSMKGSWVFVNYWAPWCQACLDEIPTLNRFSQKHKSVFLFAVNYDAPPKTEQGSLVKDLGMQYPSLSADPALALGLGDIAALPATFVFNPKGQWVDTLYGEQTLKTLERALD